MTLSSNRAGRRRIHRVVRRRIRGLATLLATPVGRLGVRDRLAEKAGRAAWPAAEAYRRTAIRHTRMVAVVGSYGKTSTTRAVVAALGGRPRATLDRNSDAVTARAVLRIRPGARHAVIEVAINGPRQMTRFARLLRPDVVVVTSIGSEHNRLLPTLEETRHEKAELVRSLPPTGLAVLNGDDPNVRWMAGQTQARVATFGFEPDNDVRATEVALEWPHGTRFVLHAGGETRPVRLRLLGRHLVYPSLAAVAVALAEGHTLDEALPPLEALPATPGRLEPVALPNGVILLRDDFKSHLETIQAALDVLAEVPARRLVVMGSVTEPQGNHRLYREVGERVGEVASHAVFLGEKFKDYVRCADCPMLERGWGNRAVAF